MIPRLTTICWQWMITIAAVSRMIPEMTSRIRNIWSPGIIATPVNRMIPQTSSRITNKEGLEWSQEECPARLREWPRDWPQYVGQGRSQCQWAARRLRVYEGQELREYCSRSEGWSADTGTVEHDCEGDYQSLHENDHVYMALLDDPNNSNK